MFGYVLPRSEELKVREKDDYQSVYCGLCHATGRKYGFLPRMFLNYDFAFLAMVLAPEAEKYATEHRRCIACPLKGKDVCAEAGWLDVAAGESIILTYWKLRDNVEDGAFWSRTAAVFLSLLLKPAYKKAAALHQSFDQEVQTCLRELHTLEREGSPSIDRTADTFARILSAAAPRTEQPDRDRAVEQMLYHVGRWIYLVDAWDDLKEDRAQGSYNPLFLRWDDGPEKHQEELRTTLRHSLNLSASAYSLAGFGGYGGIIGNILYLGLPMVEEAVWSGCWHDRKKKANRRKK
ncbi:MAG: hypothetical protein EOM52_04640 [Clostridia bacterium]|nr:hypothetical protein [Clostridia bacterium]